MIKKKKCLIKLFNQLQHAYHELRRSFVVGRAPLWFFLQLHEYRPLLGHTSDLSNKILVWNIEKMYWNFIMDLL